MKTSKLLTKGVYHNGNVCSGLASTVPVPKFIKGLGTSVRIVKITSYQKDNPTTRNISYKLVSLPSLVWFYCIVTGL